MAVSDVGRIDKIQTPTTVDEPPKAEARRRLELDRNESFERGSSADLRGFVSPVDPQTQASIASFYAAYTAEQQAQLQSASEQLGSALLNAGGTGMTSSALQDATNTALATYLTTTGTDDLGRVSQSFMYLALGGMESYLAGFASKLKEINGIAQESRTEIMELQDMLKDWPDGQSQEFTWHTVSFDENGNPTVQTHTETLSKEDAQKLLDDLNMQQQSIGDMSDMAKFDLQSKYQDYTQAVQTLAGIQKQTYDDAMKIIANLKA
jgi:hypothetical protein